MNSETLQDASDGVSITDNSKEWDNYIAEKRVAISYHEDIMKGASQSLSFPEEYPEKLELIMLRTRQKPAPCLPFLISPPCGNHSDFTF